MQILSNLEPAFVAGFLLGFWSALAILAVSFRRRGGR